MYCCVRILKLTREFGSDLILGIVFFQCSLNIEKSFYFFFLRNNCCVPKNSPFESVRNVTCLLSLEGQLHFFLQHHKIVPPVIDFHM